MVDVKYSVKAVVGMIIGLLITVFGWFIIPAMSDIIEITQLKAIFWIGLIIYWTLAVVITPVLMIMGGQGEWKGAILGFIFFIGGYILSILLYYIIPPVLESMESWQSISTFVAIGWFTIYTIWTLALIVIPAYLTIKESVLRK